MDRLIHRVVFSLAEVLVADSALRIDDVGSRPILIVIRVPCRKIIVLDNRIGDAVFLDRFRVSDLLCNAGRHRNTGTYPLELVPVTSRHIWDK
jgi:hypothetical protein